MKITLRKRNLKQLKASKLTPITRQTKRIYGGGSIDIEETAMTCESGCRCESDMTCKSEDFCPSEDCTGDCSR
ncbi:hypothetical protein ACFOEE_19390 [Pseudoalteromonas fenneropenaei]|uniref:Metallothionein n=1 Tax=Pseudoalteromonas fenneropenaei TaxID=1737459 RepID=A0ABV7CQ76_9GAMM